MEETKFTTKLTLFKNIGRILILEQVKKKNIGSLLKKIIFPVNFILKFFS